jgi:hypothetical protein
MRISVDTASQHYHPVAIYATVTLYGKKVERCIEADDETGTVIAIDPDGAVITRRGLVRITVPAEYALRWKAFNYPAIPEKNIVWPKPTYNGLMRHR